jgi:predicted permease
VAARWLPLSTELKQVLVVQAAMPAAVLHIVLTKHHRGDVTTAVWIAIGTNALGVLSIPWWIRVGMALVGV